MNYNDRHLNRRTPNVEQIYGRAYLDEREHRLCEEEIRNFCDETGARFVYYRNLKWHHPMWREFKLEGPRELLKQFDDEFCKFVEKPKK